MRLVGCSVTLKELALLMRRLGRRDHWVPPETSVEYFDTLVAPSKKLVWFEASGHEPFVDESAKFNAAMIELVRPGVH